MTTVEGVLSVLVTAITGFLAKEKLLPGRDKQLEELIAAVKSVDDRLRDVSERVAKIEGQLHK